MYTTRIQIGFSNPPGNLVVVNHLLEEAELLRIKPVRLLEVMIGSISPGLTNTGMVSIEYAASTRSVIGVTFSGRARGYCQLVRFHIMFPTTNQIEYEKTTNIRTISNRPQRGILNTGHIGIVKNNE